MQRYRWPSRFLLLCLLFLSGAAHLWAQSKTELNWYFGNDPVRLITFGKTDLEARSPEEPTTITGFGQLGAAVASGQLSGDMHFFTNGLQVFDATETLMPGGNIASDGPLSHNQAVALAPVPNSEALYYIFRKSNAGALTYAVVDLESTGNGNGDHPSGDISQGLQATGITATEAMVVIPNSNNTAYWLLAQEVGSTTLTIYEVQANTAAPLDSVGSYDLAVEGGANYEAANLAYHEPSGQLAVSPVNEGQNVLVLDFNGGALTYNRQLFGSGNVSGSSALQAVYDTEFSAPGDLLYVSARGSNSRQGQLLQYRLDTTANLPPDTIAGTSWQQSYGLQRAPDGMIYHLYEVPGAGGTLRMGRFTVPDSIGDGVTYEADPFDYSGSVRATQFPAFAPARDIATNIDFITYNTCQNQPTQFFPIFDDGQTPDRFEWDFGGQARSNSQSPVYTFDQAGQIQVTLRVYWGDQMDSVQNSVDITQFETQVQIQDDGEEPRTVGGDTVVCPGDYPLTFTAIAQSGQSGGGGGIGGGGASTSQFFWSNNPGVANAETTIDSAGTYWVYTQEGGCRAYASVRVRTYDTAQTEPTANVWYFGNQAGIDFNGEARALEDGQMNTPEGAATMSDVNGSLLFYTDGETIWDRGTEGTAHAPMPNATEIGGSNEASQSVLIMPVPDEETLYYIFTNDQVPGDLTYNMRYTVVDMKQNGTLGDVAQDLQTNSLMKALPLFDNSTERLTALGGQAGGWVLTHEYGNNTFRAYPVTADGIGAPVLSSAGSMHNLQDPNEASGYMKLSRDASLLAVPLNTSPPVVELFRFDTTGQVSDPIVLPLPDANLEPYGIEFSSGGNKLFVSARGTSGSAMYEYRVDSAAINRENAEEFINDRVADITPDGAGSLEFGAIQTAPDGQIYLALNNQTRLGIVQANEDTTLNANSAVDVDNGFDLAGRSSRLGLPNHIQSSSDQFDDPAWTIGEIACAGDTTSFSATPSSDIDTYLWDFGDGTTSTQQNPEHAYQDPGTYTVSLQIMNRCLITNSNPEGILAEFSEEVTVAEIPVDPTFYVVGENEPLQDGGYALCGDGEGVELEVRPNQANYTYVWNTGDSGRTITVNEQILLEVTIYNEAGCSSSAELIVTDGRPNVDLGGDRNICTGDSLVLDASNPTASYQWYNASGVMPDTMQTLSVPTDQAGQFTYIVEVTSPEPFNCTNSDTVVINIGARPDFEVQNLTNNTADCNDPANGTITLVNNNGDSNSNYTFDWSTGATTQDVTDLSGGTYNVTITNNASGCTQTLNDITIDDDQAGFEIVNITPTENCDPAANTVVVELDNNVFPITYEVSQGGNIVRSQSENSGDANNEFTINGLGYGDYSITVNQDGSNCNQSESFTIDQPAQVPFTIEYSLDGGQNYTLYQGVPINTCNGGQVDLRASSDSTGITFDWGGQSVGAIFTALQPGNISVAATATDGLPCESVRVIEIINSDYTVSIEQEGPLCITTTDTTATILRALPNPTGTASYIWEREAEEIQGARGQELRVRQPGNYSVTALSSSTGCQATSESFSVDAVEVQDPSLQDTYYICPSGNAGDVISLFPGEYTTYRWTRPDGTQTTTETLEVRDTGPYSLTVTDGECTTSASFNVELRCEPIVFRPNAFTPNGDTNNDVFRIEVNNFVEEFEIYIYNRWGQLVFTSENPQFEWDGTFQGKEAPLGTYAFIMRFKNTLNPEAGKQEVRGGVVLIR